MFERYRLIDGGRQMEVVFTVTDANAFTASWTARMVYQRSPAPEIVEEACAENNLDVVTQMPYPIPEETRSAF